MKNCAYIFLDEAGNFDFGEKGSRFFVLTSISARRPFLLHQLLDDLKHECLESGLNTEYFHCSEDVSKVRNSVFDVIARQLENSSIRIDSLIVEKTKTENDLREDRRFYPEMLGFLLRFVLPLEIKAGAEEVIVITDTIPVQKKRKAVEKGIKQSLAAMLPTGMKYRVLHHSSRSHFGLQVADYCCWAMFRKWQRQDTVKYDLIKKAIRVEYEVFRAEQEKEPG